MESYVTAREEEGGGGRGKGEGGSKSTTIVYIQDIMTLGKIARCYKGHTSHHCDLSICKTIREFLTDMLSY